MSLKVLSCTAHPAHFAMEHGSECQFFMFTRAPGSIIVFIGLWSGASIPPNSHGALPPNSHVSPPLFRHPPPPPPPRRQFLVILYTILCIFQ